MRLTSIMHDLEEGTSSLGLFGEPGEDGNLRPPHVQVTIYAREADTRADMRQQSIENAIAALERALESLRKELR